METLKHICEQLGRGCEIDTNKCVVSCLYRLHNASLTARIYIRAATLDDLARKVLAQAPQLHERGIFL